MAVSGPEFGSAEALCLLCDVLIRVSDGKKKNRIEHRYSGWLASIRSPGEVPLARLRESRGSRTRKCYRRVFLRLNLNPLAEPHQV